jgi:hypothetical protein
MNPDQFINPFLTQRRKGAKFDLRSPSPQNIEKPIPSDGIGFSMFCDFGLEAYHPILCAFAPLREKFR